MFWIRSLCTTPSIASNIDTKKGLLIKEPLFLIFLLCRLSLGWCLGCLFCRSLSCLSLSLCCCLSLSGCCALSCYGLSLSLVSLLLTFEASLSYVALLSFSGALYASDLALLSVEPLLEFNVSLFLADSTLLNADLEMTLQEDTFIREDTTNGVRWLSTILEPLACAINVDVDSSGVSHWIVSAKFLDKSSVSRCTTIRNNDVVERLILLTMTL